MQPSILLDFTSIPRSLFEVPSYVNLMGHYLLYFGYWTISLVRGL